MQMVDLRVGELVSCTHAILAVGAGEPRPVVKNGELTVATVMTITISCDHRAIDGAVGAEFLAAVKMFLQEPSTMLL